MKRKSVIGLLFLLVFSTVVFAGCRKKPSSATNKKVDLTYYKLFDDEDTMRPLIEDYERTHTNVTVKYRKFNNPEEYEDLILNELAEGEGPDVFEVKNTNLPRFLKKIAPLESPELTPQILDRDFVSMVVQDFVHADSSDGKQKIYGLPLAVDVPVLYYRKDLFEKKLPEQGRPSLTWSGIVNDAAQLREEDENKNLTFGGIALGRSDNIFGAVDVFFNIFLQEGGSFYDSNLKQATFAASEGIKALDFFISFSDPKNKQYGWNESLVAPDSKFKEEEAFLTGKAAMFAGYFDRWQNFAVDLKNLRAQGNKVVDLDDIGIAPLPQKSEELEEKKVFAQYYGQTVSRAAENPAAAWDFVYFITQTKQAREYAKRSGKPTARRDLLDDQQKDPILGVFVSQLGYAEGIPMYHELKYRELLDDAIQNAATGRMKPSQALSEAQEAINAFLPEKGLFPKKGK